MNLMDDEVKPKVDDKSKKTFRILIILMVLLLVGIITILMVMPMLKGEKTGYKVDGVEQSNLKSIIEIQEDGKIYIPIKEIASYLGYNAYNGNYSNKSENTSECYIESKDEVACFTVDSNIIEKINKSTSNKTYFTIDEKVMSKDGKLYTTPNGLAKAFNVYFNYKEEDKSVTIMTMNYLVNAYEKQVLELGYKEICKQFEDKKAILDGFLIVKKSNNKYGLINVQTNKEVLETKYDKVEYIPAFGDYVVESNGKKGIITNTGKERIKIQYDGIYLIDQFLKLYAVKKDNLYGVVDDTEKQIIPIACSAIGIKPSDFEKNKIDNCFVFFEKLIPIKVKNVWTLYNVEGTRATNETYSGFGCTNLSDSNTSSLLLIPEYNVLIANKNKKYVLIDENGQELLNGMEFDEAFMEANNEDKYYIVKDQKIYNAIELLEELKKRQ